MTSGLATLIARLECESKRLIEIEVQKIIPNDGGMADGDVRNRIASRTTQGWPVEANQRHPNIIVEQFGVQQAKILSMPGSDGDGKNVEADKARFCGCDVTRFRGIAASSNDLALDRPDVMFTAKELFRDTHRPCAWSWKKLQGRGSVPERPPRLLLFYDYQELASVFACLCQFELGSTGEDNSNV